MHRLSLMLSAILFAAASHAQSYSTAPMLIFNDEDSKPTAGVTTSPDDRLREFGQQTMGETITKPGSPPIAPQALEPTAAPAETKPAIAPTPAAPANPVDKLWPRNTIELFLPSCTGLKPRFVVPCTCIIAKLMIAMPHDEFLKKSEDGTLEQDPRLITIRNQCVADALKKKE